MSRAGKLTAAGRKKRAGKHVKHAKGKPYESRRRPDPFDAVLDARSEALYTDDPSAEPDTGEVKDTLARMGLGDADCPAERLYGRG